MALDKGDDSIIVIRKEEIPSEITTKTLRKLVWKQNSSFEYTEDPDGSLYFWAELKEILTKHKRRQGSSELLNNESDSEITEMADYTNTRDRSSTNTIALDVELC